MKSYPSLLANYALIAVMCATLFAGCRREDREMQCTGSLAKRSALVYFVGFTAGDLDTIRVIRYAAGTGFTVALDSSEVGTTSVVFNVDTASRMTQGNPFAVVGQNDATLISLPGAGRTFRVSDLKYTYISTTFNYTATDCKGRVFNDDPIDATVAGGDYVVGPGALGAHLFLRK